APQAPAAFPAAASTVAPPPRNTPRGSYGPPGPTPHAPPHPTPRAHRLAAFLSRSRGPASCNGRRPRRARSEAPRVPRHARSPDPPARTDPPAASDRARSAPSAIALDPIRRVRWRACQVEFCLMNAAFCCGEDLMNAAPLSAAFFLQMFLNPAQINTLGHPLT